MNTQVPRSSKLITLCQMSVLQGSIKMLCSAYKYCGHCPSLVKLEIGIDTEVNQLILTNCTLRQMVLDYSVLSVIVLCSFSVQQKRGLLACSNQAAVFWVRWSSKEVKERCSFPFLGAFSEGKVFIGFCGTGNWGVTGLLEACNTKEIRQGRVIYPNLQGNKQQNLSFWKPRGDCGVYSNKRKHCLEFFC